MKSIKFKAVILLFLVAVATSLAIMPDLNAYDTSIRLPGLGADNGPWPECRCPTWPLTCVCNIMFIPQK